MVSGLKAMPALTNTHDSPIKVQDHAIRAHYYTSLTGDDNQVMSVRQALRSLGFIDIEEIPAQNLFNSNFLGTAYR
jgi:hypothetical protein